MLEIDSAHETLAVVGPDGKMMGRITWDLVIETILKISQAAPPPVPVRRQPRAALPITVRYRTADGTVVEGRTAGIGGGGLFIESPEPLTVGSPVSLEFVLPDRPNEWLRATGRVAWVCERPDQYHFHPGMGIKFEEIADGLRARIVALVEKLLQK